MQTTNSGLTTQAAGWELLAARRAEVGAGLPVARALPTARRRSIGAWCFLDHAGPAVLPAGQGMNVGPHPHIGLQTFSWLIEGELMHRDSLGSAQLLRPGQVNLMTAGRGIVHSEESPHDRGGPLHLAQLWIALPDAERAREPAFEHHAVMPRASAGGFEVTALVGQVLGLRAPTRVYTPMMGADLACSGPARLDLPLDPSFEHGVLCLCGAARVDGASLEPGTLLYAPAGRDGTELACDGATRLLVVGGRPFDEALLVWWNFVARTSDEIAAAAADWQAGRHFGPVPGTSLARLAAPPIGELLLRAAPAARHPRAGS